MDNDSLRNKDAIRMAKTALKLKRGANTETSNAYVEKIQKILNKAEKIEAMMIGHQLFGNPAWYIKAGGIVKSSVTRTKRQLKSQGFEIECLLVSFAVMTTNPEVIAAIQAYI